MGHKSQFENWLPGAVNLISWIMNVRTALPGMGVGGLGNKCLSDDKYYKMRNLILKVGKIKKKWNLAFPFLLVAFMGTHWLTDSEGVVLKF